jgi:hypothetical protein
MAKMTTYQTLIFTVQTPAEVLILHEKYVFCQNILISSRDQVPFKGPFLPDWNGLKIG